MLEEIKRLPEDETKNEQWRRDRKRKAKMRSRRGTEDGEEINEGGGDGHGRNAVRKATARLFLRESRGIQSFLESATYISRIPQL